MTLGSEQTQTCNLKRALIMPQFFQSNLDSRARLMKQNLFKFTLFLLTSTALSACSFELRGYNAATNPNPLKELKLDCPNSESWLLCQALRQELKRNNITLSNGAAYTLKLSAISQQTRVLSLQDNAAAAEYGLSSAIHYQLIENSSQESVIQQMTKLDHSYRHESTALLAKERERQELQTRLSQQLAIEIFRQVSQYNTEKHQADTTELSD